MDFTYFTNFGSQVAVLSILPAWFEHTFDLNSVIASVVAVSYPVLNLISRPSGSGDFRSLWQPQVGNDWLNDRHRHRLFADGQA